MNPYPRDPPARGRGGRRGRPRRSAFAQLAAGGRYVPPAKWTQETLEEAWGASQDDHMRRQLVATGESPEQIEAILEAQRQERQDTITHPLEGLWGLNDGKWVIEGECPVSTHVVHDGWVEQAKSTTAWYDFLAEMAEVRAGGRRRNGRPLFGAGSPKRRVRVTHKRKTMLTAFRFAASPSLGGLDPSTTGWGV